MIRRLVGQVVTAQPPVLVVDVNGVGYEVISSTIKTTPGETLTASIFTVVKEDSITLYGFQDETERGLFAMLVNVNGVGPKSALAILGTLSPDQISSALATSDPAPFVAVKGIGKKAAERIVLDLSGAINRQPESSADTLAVASALENLGYSRREYQPLIQKLPAGTIEEQLTWALGQLAKS